MMIIEMYIKLFFSLSRKEFSRLHKTVMGIAIILVEFFSIRGLTQEKKKILDLF